METINKVFLYGASGHAKVVLDLVKLANYDVPCLVDDNLEDNILAGLPVVHSAEGLSPIIITVGNCQKRREIVNKLGERKYLTVIHPKAVMAESVKLGNGTVLMAGAIINPFVTIGNHCIVNTGASIDHDCVIDDFVHIAPHCTLCGEVEVGEGTWVGAGTTVIQGIHIGRDCFIGAGSVVVKDIPNGCLCYGNPARIIRMFNQNADFKCTSPIMGGGRITPPIYAAFINNCAA